jgi:hypothetical protein
MSKFSNSCICYLVELNNVGTPKRNGDLTGGEQDNNYRLLYYSASLQNSGQTLRLHRDITPEVREAAACGTWIDPYYDAALNPPNDRYYLPAGVTDYDDIQLPIGGSGGTTLTLNNNNQHNIFTSNGSTTSIQGESKFKFNGSKIILTGSIDVDSDGTNRNIFLGYLAGESASTSCTLAIGHQAGQLLTGTRNVAIGVASLGNATVSSKTVAVGQCALQNLTGTSNFNTAVGADVGANVSSGCANVLLGSGAGPASSMGISNKLYINNTADDTPLIYGDFSTGQLTINSEVSASVFSGSFHGDGSNLTGLSLTAFPHNGDAVITGSLTVSGSSVSVDLTNTTAISGSIFSGSFTGDGSNLTNITSNAFPHTGSAIISGSLSVEGPTSIVGSLVASGSTITLNGVTTIDGGIKIHRPEFNAIGIGTSALGTSTGAGNTALGYLAGQCLTAGDTSGLVAIGCKAGKQAGSKSTGVGINTLGLNTGISNTALGGDSMGGASSTGHSNTGVGFKSNYSISTGCLNTGVGYQSGLSITTGERNTFIGENSLGILASGCNNTALGSQAGIKTVGGSSNVYIGYQAGPSTDNTTESNQLYINNAEGTPLIKGNFSTCQVEFRGGVSGSFSGSFQGDGTNLTGITADWDGTRNGSAIITGSLTVSGSTEVVDFTNVAAISGSVFSGSFVGDGSNLTGLTGIEWDGSRDGDSNISGSLIVSGALDVGGTVTIASGSYPGGPGVELIQVNASGLISATNLYSFAIDASNGYTGFKADYALTDSSEASKKVGTVLGSWDRNGNSVVNEEHTITTGAATGTSFSVDASSTTEAIFKVNVTTGTFEINALITAFKRVV